MRMKTNYVYERLKTFIGVRLLPQLHVTLLSQVTYVYVITKKF